MTVNLAEKSFETEFRIPTRKFGFINLKTDCTIDEMVNINQTLNLAFEVPLAKPAEALKVVNAPITQAPMPTNPTPQENSKKPKHCKYCAGTEFWDNTGPNEKFPEAKPSYACKNIGCGWKFMVTNGKWWNKLSGYAE